MDVQNYNNSTIYTETLMKSVRVSKQGSPQVNMHGFWYLSVVHLYVINDSLRFIHWKSVSNGFVLIESQGSFSIESSLENVYFPNNPSCRRSISIRRRSDAFRPPINTVSGCNRIQLKIGTYESQKQF